MRGQQTEHVGPSTAASAILARPAHFITRPVMQEKFSVDEGEVVLTYPGDLSAESYQDLEDRLKIILRGAKRRVEALERIRAEEAREE
jgi:hypothetical protein